jgi:hypothetical protein
MTKFKNITGLLTMAMCVMVIMAWSTIAVAKGRGANPSVCGGESGRAFGLCNAYCEAMDCDWDLDAPEDDCADVKSNYQRLTGEEELPCEKMSLACVTGDTDATPPFPFDVGDGNDYGLRTHGLTVPEQCKCDGDDCTPCAIVVGYHGFGQRASHWKSRLEPKGAAAGFISLYPEGDLTPTNYAFAPDWNWAVPSCQYPMDGCLNYRGLPCDWCGNNTEPEAVSTQREIDFTRAIIKWTMDNQCVDPGQIFATGYSNGGLMSHLVARHPETSGLFKAVVPMDGVDQDGMFDPLRWSHAPQDGDSPWILHVNEIFDNFEPYDGMDYTDFKDDEFPWNPVWIYPAVLQIFAEYAANNDGYSDCGFDPADTGDRTGALAPGGVVPAGYQTLPDLEGDQAPYPNEDRSAIHCFTKDAEGKTCEKLAICLWDTLERGDDIGDSHGRAGRDWSGGTDPGTGGGLPMDIMWRFMQWSVGNTE